jgi:hypothetical protein
VDLARDFVEASMWAGYVRMGSGHSVDRARVGIRDRRASAHRPDLVRWETPRLCRGGSKSLTNTGVHRGNSLT